MSGALILFMLLIFGSVIGVLFFLFGYLLHSSYPLRDYRRRMLQSEMYLQLFSFFGFSNPLLFFSAMFPIGALFLLVPMQSVLDFNDSSNAPGIAMLRASH